MSFPLITMAVKKRIPLGVLVKPAMTATAAAAAVQIPHQQVSTPFCSSFRTFSFQTRPVKDSVNYYGAASSYIRRRSSFYDNFSSPAVRKSSTLSHVQVIRQQQLLKEDDEECKKVLESPNSRFLLYFKGHPLLQGQRPLLVSYEDVRPLVEKLEEKVVLLALKPDKAVVFALDVSDESLAAKFGGKFTNLRLAMLGLPREPLLSQGFSLLKWHRDTRFCAKCGSKNISKNISGNRRSCNDCNAIYYPPTSPCGISLVSSPDHSKVLLQRQPFYPPGMYSCIAGFVDVGETLFDCLKREVAEEGGVEIHQGYQIISSQHWPFPNGSLMMGCMVYADADQKPSKDDHDEIEDVKWFSAEEVKRALEFIDTNPKMRVEGSPDGSLFVPPKGTIANHMLTSWITKFHQQQ